METAEEGSSKKPRPAQFDGADGARSKHGALVRREYDILLLEATEGDHASVGATGRQDGHGALENQEGLGTAEEGDETPQHALPAQELYGGQTEARAPPERSRA